MGHHIARARAALVALASRLVPARLRDEWRREWEGELAAAADVRRPHGSCGTRSGSFVDAFWIRQRDVADLQAIDDLRHGLRQWTQQAGFVITAVGILALSMAASVTAFSVVSQILLRPLPYHESRSHRHGVGASARDAGPPRRRAGQFSRLARARDELHATGRRRSHTASTTPAATGR